MELKGATWGSHKVHVVATWCPLEAMWILHGPYWGHVGTTWRHMGDKRCPWNPTGLTGVTWGPRSAKWEPCGANWKPFGSGRGRTGDPMVYIGSHRDPTRTKRGPRGSDWASCGVQWKPCGSYQCQMGATWAPRNFSGLIKGPKCNSRYTARWRLVVIAAQ